VENYKHVLITKKIHKKVKKRGAEEEKSITQIMNDIMEKEFTQTGD